jgi:hypothetical protein
MSEPAPETQLWNIVRGALTTRALGVVADLRIADALSAGPRPVEQLARQAGADADTLHRFLRALASDGVFAEEEPGVYRNTLASELLRGGGWDDFAHLFGSIWHRTAGEIDAKTTAPVFTRLYGTDFWSWLAEHPTERAAFDRAMAGGKDRNVEKLAPLDWRGDETVVDVGGGNGALMRELLKRRPGLRAIVFDRPETDRDESTFRDRCTFVAGSFFESVPSGDVYVLSGILHDWDDEHAARILRTIHAAAPAGARLLVMDTVVPTGNKPNGAKWLDLLMLGLVGGRERTEPEWRALLERGGFPLDRIVDDWLLEASRA